MKIAHIYPINNLACMVGQQYNMLLTHLALENSAYRDFGKELSETSYTILDNSLIELQGKSLGIEAVCDMAEAMNVHEIILPDVFQNEEDTKMAYHKSMSYLHKRYWGTEIPFRIMAVAQGSSIEEFEECFDYFNRCKDIDTIGIPKICTKLHPQGRPYFEYLWEKSNKDIHLLGLWYSFTELKEYKNPGLIRSVDTCQKAFLIKHNKKWNSVRPDGFTLDLEHDSIQTSKLKGMRRLECSILW